MRSFSRPNLAVISSSPESGWAESRVRLKVLSTCSRVISRPSTVAQASADVGFAAGAVVVERQAARAMGAARAMSSVTARVL